MKNVLKIVKQKSFNFTRYAKFSTLETLHTRIDKTCSTFTVKKY